MRRFTQRATRLGLSRGELWLVTAVSISIALAIAVFATIALATDNPKRSPVAPVPNPFPVLSGVDTAPLTASTPENFAQGGPHATD